MKTEKYISKRKNWFRYEINVQLIHGFHNYENKEIGYGYQGKIRGFWLENEI